MIELRRESLKQESFGGQTTWPLKVSARSLQNGLSDRIFVFHASMQDDLYCGDVFEAVASVQQMTDIPEEQPGFEVTGDVCPYYRKDNFTFLARSPAEAEELWKAIMEDVEDLSRNWAALSNMETSGYASPNITLDENVNAAGRDMVNLDKIGIRTTVPEYAIDIDPFTNPVTPDRGIRFGGDARIFRESSGVLNISSINVTGAILLNGIPLAGALSSELLSTPSFSITGSVAGGETVTFNSSTNLPLGHWFFKFHLIAMFESKLLGVQITGVCTVTDTEITGSGPVTSILSDANWKIIVGTTDTIPMPEVVLNIVERTFRVTITNTSADTHNYTGSLFLYGKNDE